MDPTAKFCAQAIMNMPFKSFASALMSNTHTYTSFAQAIQASMPEQHNAANRKVRRESNANEEQATRKQPRTSRYEPILKLQQQFFG
eukprot:654623-Rhodomonas_salina.1